MLMLWHHVLVRESRGHLLVGMGQVGLRHRGCWLRSWGHVWMYMLRWPLHGAWNHLRVMLGCIARCSLVALGELRLGLIAILLMWLQLPREHLLVMGRNARLRGHISMMVALLSREMRVRTRHSPWPRLVPLRQWMPDGLRVRLFLLLWLRWSGHELGVGIVASRGCRRAMVVLWGRGVAGDRGLDVIHDGGRRPDWGRGYEARLGGLRMGWPIT